MEINDFFEINQKMFSSRLMLGTGKYNNLYQAKISIEKSECNIITVAVRRAQAFQFNIKKNLINSLNWKKLWLLPNTAGCKTVEESIRVAFLGREMTKIIGQEDNSFVKLEVISDPYYLLPDSLGTLKAAEFLVNKGFTVLPYIGPDPIISKQLEEVGCATVMPLASPIGSGQGLKNLHSIQIIIENANIPVIIDAGIGTPSEAAKVMELGATAVLVNTAIAKATNPIKMAEAMKLAVKSGRMAYLSGRIPIQNKASASSPLKGISKILEDIK